MEVTPMNAHLMDSFPGYRGCSARRASTRGVSPLEQEPKNYARELECKSTPLHHTAAHRFVPSAWQGIVSAAVP